MNYKEPFMKKFTSILLTLCFLTLSCVTSTAQNSRGSKPLNRANQQLRSADQALRVTGGFIQLDEAEMRFTRWPELLGELNARAGMDTFIIQRLFFRHNGTPRSHIALRA